MLPFKLPSQLIYFLKTLRSYQTSFFIHGLLGTIVDIEFINMKIFSHQIELWHTLHIVHKLKFLKRCIIVWGGDESKNFGGKFKQLTLWISSLSILLFFKTIKFSYYLYILTLRIIIKYIIINFIYIQF